MKSSVLSVAAVAAFALAVAASPVAAATEADIQRVIDAHAGGTAVVPPGAYDIGATVFVPSDTKLVLKGCRLRMRDGAVCPMFRNRSSPAWTGFPSRGSRSATSAGGRS